MDARRENNYQTHHLVPELYRVNILVKESRNIPISIHKYSVKIAIDGSYFDGETGKTTSEVMALHSPKWNQTLPFLIKSERNTIQLDLSLCCTDKQMNNKQRISLKSLMDCAFVDFETKTFEDKYIQVRAEATITRVIINDVDVDSGVSFSRVPLLGRLEKDFVPKRQDFVFEKMKNNGLTIRHKRDVPNIAIIGSGGGMRAVIGMCGAITALEDLGILDYAMYMAGVSGSAWYLTTLYAYEDKKLDPKAVYDSLRSSVQSPFGSRLWQTWNYWRSYTESRSFSHGKYFTTTDSYGEMIGAILLDKKCTERWSDQKKKLEHGCAPLPLLSALKISNEENLEVNEWVEISPYEVRIPTYGVAINMTEFGDRFFGGFVTKKYGEQPIHFLQGVCGSAYAKVLDPKKSEGHIYKYLGYLRKGKDWLYSWFNNPADKIVARVPNWLQGISIVATRTMENGRPRPSHKKFVDGQKEDMMLIDAGIEFNLPYPPILHPSRKVELILSFDFSYREAGKKSPFEELKKAEKWADERGVPFPNIQTDDKNEPYEELYIFEGGLNEPTILHFVMINNRFRKNVKEESYKDLQDMLNVDIFADYHTFRFSYSALEFERLKSLMEYNVRINGKKLKKCIEDAIQKKSNQFQQIDLPLLEL